MEMNLDFGSRVGNDGMVLSRLGLGWEGKGMGVTDLDGQAYNVHEWLISFLLIIIVCIFFFNLSQLVSKAVSDKISPSNSFVNLNSFEFNHSENQIQVSLPRSEYTRIGLLEI